MGGMMENKIYKQDLLDAWEAYEKAVKKWTPLNMLPSRPDVITGILYDRMEDEREKFVKLLVQYCLENGIEKS